MRIVHIVPSLSKGGGERVAVDLANHAARRGHEVTVVAVAKVDESLLRKDLLPAVEVLYIAKTSARIARYPQVIRWVIANHRRLRKADIVHCHMTISSVIGTLLFLIRKLSRGSKPAIVETYHAVGMPIPRWQTWLHGRLAKRRDALALMAEDPHWSSFAKKQHNLAVRLIPNGIAVPDGCPDEAERLAFRRALGIPDECPLVIGTVGRLDPARRPWLYPKIFSRLARRFPEAHFVIGGTGPEVERVRQAISEEGLSERVHLPGLVQDPRLAFSTMDLYITLNVGPITGVAGIEAAFSGLPIIAIQLLEGYCAPETDWIWSSADIAEIAEYGISLLERPERLRMLAEAQQAHARDYHSIEVMAASYESLYEVARVNAACGDVSHSR